MAQLIPPFGSTGGYKAREPFNTVISDGVSYTCRSLREVNELVSHGVDIWAEYYEPYNIDPDIYSQDIVDNVTIVGLQSGLGQLYYIPASYLTQIPVTEGETYVTLMLGVSLGSIPDSFAVTPLIEALRSVVQANVGIDPQIKAVAVGQPTVVSLDKAERLEKARIQKITELETDYVKAKRLQAEVDKLKNQVAVLSKALASRMNP